MNRHLASFMPLLVGIIFITMQGCSAYEHPRPYYFLASTWDVDSAFVANREVQRAAWVTETVRAASERMTTADYEDAYKTINEATEASYRMFPVSRGTQRLVVGLVYMAEDRSVYPQDIVRPQDMNAVQLVVFDSLRRRSPAKFIGDGLFLYYRNCIPR